MSLKGPGRVRPDLPFSRVGSRKAAPAVDSVGFYAVFELPGSPPTQENRLSMNVPFFRPDLGEAEIEEVVDTLRSGWLTTGPKVGRFETAFAEAVGGKHAVGLNSCTAALHLAVEALGLEPGQAVLVPAMTMAATAEVVRYQGAVPILVDCDPVSLNLDFADAQRKLDDLDAGRLQGALGEDLEPVGIIPVHVAGHMVDLDELEGFADHHGLWVVEDAAHAFPAAWRRDEASPWRRCGEGTSAVSCFSFYANKTITTGEGGMAVTEEEELAERMRTLSLHGMSKDAWGRFTAKASWDYRIIAPGFKYNLTDIAAAIGLHQLTRAEEMRRKRQDLVHAYFEALKDVDEIELPPDPENRIHSWHLFLAKLRLDRLNVDRAFVSQALREAGIGHSVHWRPLHLHPYYEETFRWRPEQLPEASAVWPRILTLPLFPTMTGDELERVVSLLKDLCRRHGKRG